MGKTVSRGRGRTPGHHGSDEPPFPTTLRRASTSKSHDLRRVVTTASVRELAGAAAAAAFEDTTEHNRRVSHGRTHRTDSDRARMQTIQGSRANSAFGDDEITFQDGSALDDSPSPTPTDKRPSSPPLDPTSPPPLSRGRRVFLGVKSFVFSLITPPTIALVSALVCALVIPLKALFVLIPEGNFHPTAPDGGPVSPSPSSSSPSLTLSPFAASRNHLGHGDVRRKCLCPPGTARPRFRTGTNASPSTFLQTPHRFHRRSRRGKARHPPHRRVLFRPNSRPPRYRREGEHGPEIRVGLFQLRADCYYSGEFLEEREEREEADELVMAGRAHANLCTRGRGEQFGCPGGVPYCTSTSGSSPSPTFPHHQVRSLIPLSRGSTASLPSLRSSSPLLPSPHFRNCTRSFQVVRKR